jgi:endonuclease/exonuclease/phosphatase family metal-dependent hydrolase
VPTRSLVVIALAALGVAAPPASAAKKKPPRNVTVMTRNVYLGADITRPIVAVQGKTGGAALVAFGNANYQTRAIVDQTNFPARAKVLAAEIAGGKPDLVGLQEVTTWRRGPKELNKLGQANATTVDIDFLKLLQKELVKRKSPYKVVRAQQESDVEGPAFQSSDPFANEGFDVRLTLRDVLLRRKTSKVRISSAHSKQYDAHLDISFSGVTFRFIRGAVWADAKLGTHKFRIVTTHLESQTSELALAQAQELLAGPAAVKGKPVIVVCDCNSDPNEAVTEDGYRGAYQALTGQSPYASVGVAPLFDTWTSAHPADLGLTSGFTELVNDPDTSNFKHRIDLVLGRTAAGTALKVITSKITGLTKTTPTGLHPSDHAGVMAKIRL